jgi:hypothetical protein
MRNLIVLAAVIAVATGCRSFKTTALYRFPNDSIAPEKSNARLLGLPVKLKVPSHVLVTIYEEQVILAISPATKDNLEEKAKAARDRVVAQKNKIEKLTTNITVAEAKEKSLNSLITIAKDELSKLPADSTDPAIKAQRSGIEQIITDAETARVNAKNSLETAKLAKATTEANEVQKLAELQAAAEVAAEKAAVGYTLISFTPAQFHVESELQYTDKVFLVDFKRPAGGILDLTGASMDEEQYFSDVQAAVTERTLQDVSTAINTLTGNTTQKATPDPQKADAKPVSAKTPEAESNQEVSFQKSVIATKRFDISDCNWEREMQEFVSLHLGRPDLLQNAPQVEYSSEIGLSDVSDERSGSWHSAE